MRIDRPVITTWPRAYTMQSDPLEKAVINVEIYRSYPVASDTIHLTGQTVDRPICQTVWHTSAMREREKNYNWKWTPMWARVATTRDRSPNIVIGFLLEFTILATSKVISKRVPTCESAHA